MDLAKELKTLAELGEKRNEKTYAWLRWLVLLCAGFFSLMVGQLTGKKFDPAQLLCLKIALGLNAAGILSGAIALYGDVSSVRRLAQAYSARIEHMIHGRHESVNNAPIVGKPSWLSRKSEWLCYVALTGSLVAFVAFVILL